MRERECVTLAPSGGEGGRRPGEGAASAYDSFPLLKP
jgi:hypothetical protein